MFKLFFFGLCIFLIASCGKSNSSGPASFQYKMNGQLIQLSGGRDTTKLNPNTGYNFGCYATGPLGGSFYAFQGMDNNNEVILVVRSQGGLKAGQFNNIYNSVSLTAGDSVYGINNVGDGINIAVLRYSNGTADGTFSGQLSTPSGNKQTVSDGQFYNLKLYP
jgi:hypothetical protein